MWKSASVLIGVAHLLSIASALPLEARAECPAGTAFYVCNINNFRGCCSIDPCAIKAGCPDKPSSTTPPAAASSSPAPPASSAPALSIPSPVSAPVAAAASCKAGTKNFKQFMPILRTIGVANSDPSLFKIANITATKTDISQVFTFSNIPSTAKNIALMWFISKTVPEFSTKDSATGRAYLLDSAKLPAAGQLLTKEAVAAAIERSTAFPNGSVGGAGFGFWDSPEFPKPHDHTVSAPTLPARSTLSFSIGIFDAGEVVIRQTQQDGLYLQYDC